MTCGKKFISILNKYDNIQAQQNRQANKYEQVSNNYTSYIKQIISLSEQNFSVNVSPKIKDHIGWLIRIHFKTWKYSRYAYYINPA